MSARATTNFTWAELGNPPDRMRANSRRLALCLETLRRQLGGHPIRLISAYRAPAHNARVGGADKSQHLRGAAADIAAGVCTAEQARAAGFSGIGQRGPWATHLDVRPGPGVHWHY